MPTLRPPLSMASMNQANETQFAFASSERRGRFFQLQPWIMVLKFIQILTWCAHTKRSWLCTWTVVIIVGNKHNSRRDKLMTCECVIKSIIKQPQITDFVIQSNLSMHNKFVFVIGMVINIELDIWMNLFSCLVAIGIDRYTASDFRLRMSGDNIWNSEYIQTRSNQSIFCFRSCVCHGRQFPTKSDTAPVTPYTPFNSAYAFWRMFLSICLQ